MGASLVGEEPPEAQPQPPVLRPVNWIQLSLKRSCVSPLKTRNTSLMPEIVSLSFVSTVCHV